MKNAQNRGNEMKMGESVERIMGINGFSSRIGFLPILFFVLLDVDWMMLAF